MKRIRPLLVTVAIVLAGWLLAAYVVLPMLWRHYEHQKKLDGLPMVTVTTSGIPGDAINVGFVGSGRDIACAMHAAGWYPADPVTLKSSLEIIGSVLLDRPYRDAPVSPLLYAGRKQDLAFEKPAGTSADRRHHVRLWKVLESGDENRPVWLGAVTFDRSVGLSHTTGQVTHHIDADIDRERDGLAADLEKAGMLQARYQVMGLGPTLFGRNGGGDRYYTDGEVWMMRLVEDCQRTDKPPEILPSPQAVEFKDQIWKSTAALFRSEP
jgi:hypothetical protein